MHIQQYVHSPSLALYSVAICNKRVKFLQAQGKEMLKNSSKEMAWNHKISYGLISHTMMAMT
jgi:hypothetical protein